MCSCWGYLFKSLRLRRFKSDRDKILQKRSSSKCASIGGAVCRIFHLTSQFRDGGHDDISSKKVLPPGGYTHCVCPASMQQSPPVPNLLYFHKYYGIHWRRPPGRPKQTWLHQIGDGFTASIRQEWDLAIGGGHSRRTISALRTGLRRPRVLMMMMMMMTIGYTEYAMCRPTRTAKYVSVNHFRYGYNFITPKCRDLMVISAECSSLFPTLFHAPVFSIFRSLEHHSGLYIRSTGGLIKLPSEAAVNIVDH